MSTIAPASRPPEGLPGLDPGWSRLVEATDPDGVPRTWHVLDTHHVPDTRPAPGVEAATPAAGNGAAPVGTILCVHGNPTWSYAFRHLLAEPPPGWRVIAVDQLEMGYSERTGQHRPLARRIGDLARLTAALELTGPVIPVAHDWGGPVALGWALAHRAQVAGVVLSNTAVHQPPDAAAPALIRGARLRGLLDLVTVRTPTFVRGATALSRPPLPRAVRDAYAAPYATPARRVGIGGFVRDIPLDPDHPSATTLDAVADGLPELADVPVLLFWGPLDPVFSDRYLHDLEARLPHADVHRAEGASHLAPEDADLAGAVTRWLSARVDLDRQHDVEVLTRSVVPDPDATHGADPEDDPDRTPAWAAILDPARADTDAIVEPSDPTDPNTGPRRISFGELADDVHALALGLHRHGVRPGDRVACLVTPGRELATLLYACWRLGAIVVIADAGLGPRGLSRALRSAAPDHLVGISRALAAATALRWPGRRIAASDVGPRLARSSGATTSIPDLIADGIGALAEDPEPGEGTAPSVAAADATTPGADAAGPSANAAGPSANADASARADALLPRPPSGEADAAVVFTSGSTGPAKGVVYRHRQLEAQRDALAATYAIGDDDRLVAAFAPFALYGPALGITSMVPAMDVTAPSTLTATALADAVVATDATLVFASPAALVNVAATADDLRSHQRTALAGVRLLLSAGAPVPAELLRELTAILPAAEPHTPYGMTETLPVADIDLATIDAVGLGQGVCVGHPVPGVEVAISALDADAAATGALTEAPHVTGEVCIRAPHGKDRYDRLAVTELASSRDEGWHRSGDVGHLDDDGRLWIEGRLSQVITTADGVVTPVGIERRVEAIERVKMAAAVGVGPPGTQQVVVVVTTDPPPGRMQLAPLSLTDRVRRAVDVDVAAVLAVPNLPVDVRHESKIDRVEVAASATDLLAGRGLRRGDGA